MTKNAVKSRARDAAFGRFARKMKKFPPNLDESSKKNSALASLNPNAREFVPSPSSGAKEADLTRPEVAEIPMLDGLELPAELATEDVEAILALRKALPSGQRIKYTMKQLFAMKPLNPNAPVFTPLWLQGIHTERDFAMLQGQLYNPATTTSSSSSSGGNTNNSGNNCSVPKQDSTFFRAQKAS